MAIKIEAWLDSQGKLHEKEESALVANMRHEILTSFNKHHSSSESVGLFAHFIASNYNLIKKVKR